MRSGRIRTGDDDRTQSKSSRFRPVVPPTRLRDRARTNGLGPV